MQKTNKKDYIKEGIKFNNLEKEKGITLVALIITVIVLLILTGLAIKVVVDGRMLKKSEKTINKANEQSIRETEIMNNMLSDWTDTSIRQERINTRIEINAIVESFNSSLGAFPTVYTLVGKLNEKIIYEDITYINSSSAGTNTISLNTSFPEKTEVTVTEVYSGTSYSLTTDNNLKQIVQKENEESTEVELTFNFTHKYNGGNRGNAVGMVADESYSAKKSDGLSGYSLTSNSNNFIKPVYYAGNGGGAVVDLGANICINQKSENSSEMNVQNTSSTNETWVRIKIFATPNANYSVDRLEKNNNWEKNITDEYYYYLPVLSPNGETTTFTVMPEQDGFHDEVKTIIVAECTPIIYDEDANSYADWTYTYDGE